MSGSVFASVIKLKKHSAVFSASVPFLRNIGNIPVVPAGSSNRLVVFDKTFPSYAFRNHLTPLDCARLPVNIQNLVGFHDDSRVVFQQVERNSGSDNYISRRERRDFRKTEKRAGNTEVLRMASGDTSPSIAHGSFTEYRLILNIKNSTIWLNDRI